MELRDYWGIVQRRWLLIVGCLGLALAAAAVVTATTTPLYSSSARIFVSTSGDESTSTAYQGGLFAVQRVASYADLVESRELAQTVGKELDLSDAVVTDLPDQVEAKVVPETVILELTVTDPSAAKAQTIAQAYATAMKDLVKNLETPSGASSAPIKATIVDSASFSPQAVSPQPLRNYGLAAVLGLLLGLGIAVLREVLDNTVKTNEQATEISGASVLGTINYDAHTTKHPLITSLDSHAPRAEAFRVLRTNMQFLDIDVHDEGRAYVVSSSVPGEGKTTTALNLALTLAQAGEPVVLIEGDLRRPRVTTTLGMDDAIGLTSVLVGKVSLGEALQTDTESGLVVLPSGAIPPNPAELIQSQAMHEVMAELRKKFSLVIVDAPPLLPVTDAALLGSQADGVLLVIRHGKTTTDQVAHSIERLSAVDARLVGIVRNMVPSTRGSRSGYGYGYGYGYAPLSATKPEPTGRRAKRRRLLSPGDAATESNN